VMGVSAPVFGENAPERVKLTMFPEQVLPAEDGWRYVPNPHG
jgi:hypothetical protein